MGYGGTNGRMLRNQLRSIRRAADTLYDATVDGDQVPEWVLTKVAVTLDNLQTAEDYILSKIEGYKPNPRINVEKIKKNAFRLKRLVKNRKNPIKKYKGELKNNRHLTAVYTGFMSPEKAKYLKGKKEEHKKWDFERGSCHGRGRYSYKDWEKFKKDAAKNGIKERVFVVAEWVNGKVKATVYEGNHRIRIGCQLDIPIPVEIRFFGQAEDFVDEANSSLDFDDEKIWAKVDQDLARVLRYGFIHE